MDPLKLLSRSTRLSKRSQQQSSRPTPPSGQIAQPQLWNERNPVGSRKRKRGQDETSNTNPDTAVVDFFGTLHNNGKASGREQHRANDVLPGQQNPIAPQQQQKDALVVATQSLEERMAILKKHKLKITYLNPPSGQKKVKRRAKHAGDKANKAKHLLFPNPLQSLGHLSDRFGIPRQLVDNIVEQGFAVPTEVQLGALPLLLEEPSSYLSADMSTTVSKNVGDIDLLTVAPTGSGKTLAFMIPLMHALIRGKKDNESSHRHVSTIILAPTRELASQTVNEGRKLTKNTGISITQMRKGMRFVPKHDTDGGGEATGYIVKADVLVATPGVLQAIVSEQGQSEAMSRVRRLVLDEADVLLHPLFRDQTLEIWNSLTNLDLRVSMWSATMGSNIEELARSIISERRQRLSNGLDTSIAESPLIRLVVGSKDSAVPNVQHRLVYAATEQGKLMGLRQLLHPTNSVNYGPSLRPPFLVFTQTIERAIALHAELLYDIPAEAGGISRIAVLHSDLSDTARDNVMTQFRKGEIWILITTDLLSRGMDFRGVNGVVNYDIPTSSAAYVHRIGRTGRAGREGGVAVTLYSKEDLPYLKHVANVVAMAHRQKGEAGDMQQWLLDALPKLSQNEKHKLKKHGIESRTARGKEKDPKAARKARISSKAGYVRQEENRRKGAILGSQRMLQQELASDAGDETEFGGFD